MRFMAFVRFVSVLSGRASGSGSGRLFFVLVAAVGSGWILLV